MIYMIHTGVNACRSFKISTNDGRTSRYVPTIATSNNIGIITVNIKVSHADALPYNELTTQYIAKLNDVEMFNKNINKNRTAIEPHTAN